MSIKDYFGRKTVIIKNAESGSIDAESPNFILSKIEQEETFVPPVDFSTASNFIRFGSAELYYQSALTNDEARPDVRAQGFWGSRNTKGYFESKSSTPMLSPTGSVPCLLHILS